MSKEIAKPESKDTIISILQDIRINELLLAEFAEANDGEISDYFTDREKELYSKLALKTEATVSYWKFLEKEIDFYAEEEKQISAKKKTMQNQLKKLKDYLRANMEYSGIHVMDGKPNKITLENSGGILPLVFSEENIDPNTLPEDLTSRVIDNAKIREALDSGRELQFVRYGERGKTVRIR